MASISIVSSLQRPSVGLAKVNHARHVTSQVNVYAYRAMNFHTKNEFDALKRTTFETVFVFGIV